jgi:transposase
MDLTDKQWEILAPLVPKKERREDGKGRPPTPRRDLLNGILWILRTGARWKDLPSSYPPYQTCHRWFQQWVDEGAMGSILEALAKDLEERGKIDIEEAFIDGSFSGAKKGDPPSGKPSVARGRRSWVLSTAMVFLSPFPLQVLRRMKQSSSTRQ